MASSYPSSVKSFSTKLAGQTIDAAHVNDLQDEVVAVEGALLNGTAHALKPASAGAQDLGTVTLPWGITRTRGLNFDAVSTLTIAAGVVTATRSHHALDTESAAASDDLDTITAGTGLSDGFVLILRPANVARVVTVKDGSGNLLLNGDYVLNATDRTLTLVYDGTNWREVGRSVPNTGAMTLLKSGSGTDASAGATNLDTVAISGLTARDTLIVYATIGSTTQLTTAPSLYNVTDSVTLITDSSDVAAASVQLYSLTIRQRQTATTAIVTQGAVDNGGTGGNPHTSTKTTAATFLTAYTGSWTLALRHGGVTAGGTCDWSWTVVKVTG